MNTIKTHIDYPILPKEDEDPVYVPTTTVIPSYGRDYPTALDAMKAWDANVDFLVADVTNRWDGKPINKSTSETYDTPVMIRFNDKTDIVFPHQFNT